MRSEVSGRSLQGLLVPQEGQEVDEREGNQVWQEEQEGPCEIEALQASLDSSVGNAAGKMI